jgi:UDP-N-acetylglucosamine 2-epimerase (non-hydrolysing)
MEEIDPDALILYGDTNSCLSAIAAKRRKIPIFHFEAGNRCFDLRVPEEINRKIVDHTSDINFTLTEHARRYLINEGIRGDRIFKSGSHMYEVLEDAKEKILDSNILNEIKLKKNKYFLVSIHREENVDDEKNFSSLIKILNELSENYNLPIVISTHPRTQKKLDQLKIKKPKNLMFMKPFGFFDYINLQQNSYCVISDSGTITEESSILKFPAINIRNAHERPEVIMAGINSDRIRESIDMTVKHYKSNKSSFEDIKDYKNMHVSKQVVRTILSYIDVINKDVWKKKI